MMPNRARDLRGRCVLIHMGQRNLDADGRARCIARAKDSSSKRPWHKWGKFGIVITQTRRDIETQLPCVWVTGFSARANMRADAYTVHRNTTGILFLLNWIGLV